MPPKKDREFCNAPSDLIYNGECEIQLRKISNAKDEKIVAIFFGDEKVETVKIEVDKTNKEECLKFNYGKNKPSPIKKFLYENFVKGMKIQLGSKFKPEVYETFVLRASINMNCLCGNCSNKKLCRNKLLDEKCVTISKDGKIYYDSSMTPAIELSNKLHMIPGISDSSLRVEFWSFKHDDNDVCRINAKLMPGKYVVFVKTSNDFDTLEFNKNVIDIRNKPQTPKKLNARKLKNVNNSDLMPPAKKRKEKIIEKTEEEEEEEEVPAEPTTSSTDEDDDEEEEGKNDETEEKTFD